ncbi:MAG: diaminopimelate decarboxylase [Brevinematia bacterium]
MNLNKLDNFKNIDLLRLVEEFGTPLYVYNLDKVKENFTNLYNSIPYRNKKILFAMKSNFNVDVLKVIKSLSGGIDAISVNEVKYALELGFDNKDILFTGIGISNEEIDFCFSSGIIPNAGSIDLLSRIGFKYPGSKVSIRINPDFGAGHHDHVITGGSHSKFGIYESYLDEVEKISKKYDLVISGVHFHIGSGILDYRPFIDAIRKALNVVSKFKDIEFIDIGGGIGIPYKPDDAKFDLKSFGEKLGFMMEEFSGREGRDVKLIIEPGRFLVAESGVLLTKVVEIKHTPMYKFVIVNSGFNHLVRPIMYGSYHEIINLSKLNSKDFEEQVIAGNVCESGDIFTRDEEGIKPRLLPIAEYGDILGIFDSGAYGYAMASHYNLRNFPKEVVISDGKYYVSERSYLKFVL